MDYGASSNHQPFAWCTSNVWAEYVVPIDLSHAYSDVNEWSGAIQFGSFNRFHMCPVLEVGIQVVVSQVLRCIDCDERAFWCGAELIRQKLWCCRASALASQA